MTLNLQMLATLDAKGVEQGAAEARREIGRLGSAVDQAATANDRAAASAARSAKAHEAAAAAARRQAQAAQNGGLRAANATRLAAHEVTNLSYQMNDIAVGFASGQSPFTIMAQQGLQVSQIMGRRGLGQIIPAIGTGLLSLINPTTLVLAGITAIGYGASAVFSSMREDISDTDAAVERHTDLISRIEEAYDRARQGLERYGAQTDAVLEADRQEGVRDLQKRLDAQVRSYADSDVFDPYSLRPDYQAPSQPYRQALDEVYTFQEAVKAGEADVLAFHQRISELAAAGPQSDLRERERDILKTIRDDAQDALETAEKLKALLEGLDEIGLKKQREALTRFLTGRSDRSDLLRREADVVAQARRTGADREEYKRLSIRIKAEEQARQKILADGFKLDSEEAGKIRESYRAHAQKTIELNRQKTAYERLLDAREAITGQNDHIARLKLETTLVGASNVERQRQIALLEAEQDIVKRRIDPGGTEAEQLRQAAAARAAAEARLEEARFAEKLARGHGEEMQRLRLERLLIGQSNDVRSRAIALLEAEQEIRRRGIETNSQLARTIRDNARALAQERTELERHKRAWGEVERAGTSAIDRITDGIASGDIGGALEAVAKDQTKTVLRLSTANPLKNALYGAGLPTLSDTGGISGFFSALLGGGPQAMRAANMNVQAATVVLNGGLSSLTAVPRFALASAGAGQKWPGGRSAAFERNTVAAQAWNFFSGKGLKDFHVAGILGHMKAESGFNPLATGDGGNAFGLFQHNDRRHNLFNFLGGKGNLGNVQGQLEFAWKELMTTESRAFRNLMGSTDLRGATAAFGGFERPRGFSHSNPEAMHNWTGRLKAAEEALNQFGGQAGSASKSLTAFDGGIGRAASSLSNGSANLADTATDFVGQSRDLAGSLSKGVQNLVNSFPAAPLGGGSGGGLASWVGRLLSGFGGIGGGSQLASVAGGAIGLFDTGGPTGSGRDDELAGFTHRNEFVFSAPAVRAIGIKNLEALHSGSLHGFRDGGSVSTHAMPLPQPANGNASGSAGMNELTIRLIDGDGNEIATRQSRTPDGLQLDVLIDQANGRLFTKRGTRSRQALEAFDARNKVGSR